MSGELDPDKEPSFDIAHVYQANEILSVALAVAFLLNAVALLVVARIYAVRKHSDVTSQLLTDEEREAQSDAYSVGSSGDDDEPYADNGNDSLALVPIANAVPQVDMASIQSFG